MLQYKDQRMNEHPRKVSSLETFDNHIAVQNRTLHARWNNCVRRKAARRRFDTYIAKVKVMDNFWQLVANQDVKAVVYGSADFDATGKSEHAVPVGGVFNRTKRYMKVILTPEPNTKENRARCWNPAEKCENGGWSIRCRSTQCPGRNRRCRKDRDANACKNMRPKELWLETIGEIVSEAFKSRQRTMWIARRRARDSTGAIYLGTKGDVI